MGRPSVVQPRADEQTPPRGAPPSASARILRRARVIGAAVARHPRSVAFLAYLVLGILTAGWYAIRAPGSVCACIGNADPATYMWSLGWWPHAVTHGLNPVVSHYVWSPTGDNLARRATIPAAAFALWPVSALFGVVVAYNVLSIASPVLAAFTAYLLGRRLIGREVPALVCGYIFGFGPYLFAQLIGHLNLTLIFLVPVMVHLALRRIDREISARLYVVAMAAAIAVQIGLSTELMALAGAMALVALLAARLIAAQPQRGRVTGLFVESAGAGILAALVTSPFLYYALIKGGQPNELPLISDSFGLDLINPIIPTVATWLGSHSFAAVSATFEGANVAEADGYLSAALLVAFAMWALRTPRRVLARMLGVIAAVSFLAALGSHLHVTGYQTIWLPYDLIRHLPVVRLITPSRIVLFTALAVALGVGAWLAERSPRSLAGGARWLLVALGLVMIFPNIASRLWGEKIPNPAFFRERAYYSRYLEKGETLLALPFAQNDDSMLWQAETGFYFRMPEGYLGHYAPAPFATLPIIGELGANKPVERQALLAFLRTYQVRDVVIALEAGSSPYASQLEALGYRGTDVGGVRIIRVGA